MNTCAVVDQSMRTSLLEATTTGPAVSSARAPCQTAWPSASDWAVDLLTFGQFSSVTGMQPSAFHHPSGVLVMAVISIELSSGKPRRITAQDITLEGSPERVFPAIDIWNGLGTETLFPLWVPTNSIALVPGVITEIGVTFDIDARTRDTVLYVLDNACAVPPLRG